ncbi:MAG TPA: 50S ribosomal protein L11 methyltransferase [Xanthomonadaceae bacterium]|nr:50S ribosomal protein L11 methyltransferase [Xanthomonadaceae bacterium]
MPWLEFSIRCQAAQQPEVEAALEELGALSVTLLDAADDPILEPGVGETPLWPNLIVQGLFDGALDRLGLERVLTGKLERLPPDAFSWRHVENQDWERAWMDRFEPMRFGQRLWIYPSHIEPPADAGVVVRLDPGLAFGTGTHPTTALCLQWLDQLDLSGRTVLDFGCGSGVLAIAAARLGAVRVVAVDNDPQALTATRENARVNGVAARIGVYPSGQVPAGPFDFVVANILANALHALAGRLAQATAPGGAIALSGILAGQQPGLLERYATWFEDFDVAAAQDWVRIVARRRG